MQAFISVSEREIADASMRAVSKPSGSDEHVSNVVWRNGRRIRRGRGAEKRNSVTTCVNRTFSEKKNQRHTAAQWTERDVRMKITQPIADFTAPAGAGGVAAATVSSRA